MEREYSIDQVQQDVSPPPRTAQRLHPGKSSLLKTVSTHLSTKSVSSDRKAVDILKSYSRDQIQQFISPVLDNESLENRLNVNKGSESPVYVAESIYDHVQTWLAYSSQDQSLRIGRDKDTSARSANRVVSSLKSHRVPLIYFVGGDDFYKCWHNERLSDSPNQIRLYGFLKLLYTLISQLIKLQPTFIRSRIDLSRQRLLSLGWDDECVPQAIQLFKDLLGMVSHKLYIVLVNVEVPEWAGVYGIKTAMAEKYCKSLAANSVNKEFGKYFEEFLSAAAGLKISSKDSNAIQQGRRLLLLQSDESPFIC